MFAKLATFKAFNLAAGRRSAPAATPGNDNQPVHRFTALSRPLHRPVLLCRWRTAATGGLECDWHMEAAAASKVEEPGISRRLGRARFGHRTLRRGTFVTLEHLAIRSAGCRM